MSGGPFIENEKGQFVPFNPEGEGMGETISGDAPYEFDDAGHDVNYRSAETGQFVSEEEAEAHPETTVKETRPAPITETLGVNPKGHKAKLNKRSILLNLAEQQHDPTEYAWFVHLDEDGQPMDGMNMPIALWDDFGQPDTITVVVYPRDMLN